MLLSLEINPSIVNLQWPVWASLSCKSVISKVIAVICWQHSRQSSHFLISSAYESICTAHSSLNTYLNDMVNNMCLIAKRAVLFSLSPSVIFTHFSFFHNNLSTRRHLLKRIHIHKLRRAPHFAFINNKWWTPQPRHPKWRQIIWHNKGKSHILWVICDYFNFFYSHTLRLGFHIKKNCLA